MMASFLALARSLAGWLAGFIIFQSRPLLLAALAALTALALAAGIILAIITAGSFFLLLDHCCWAVVIGCPDRSACLPACLLA